MGDHVWAVVDRDRSFFQLHVAGLFTTKDKAEAFRLAHEDGPYLEIERWEVR